MGINTDVHTQDCTCLPQFSLGVSKASERSLWEEREEQMNSPPSGLEGSAHRKCGHSKYSKKTQLVGSWASGKVRRTTLAFKYVYGYRRDHCFLAGKEHTGTPKQKIPGMLIRGRTR